MHHSESGHDIVQLSYSIVYSPPPLKAKKTQADKSISKPMFMR